MDFVTVCHTNDLPQMKLQARSLNKFLLDFPINQIFIIINDLNYSHCYDYIINNVLEDYGYFKQKVKIIDGNQLLKLTHGYLDQQKLKIKISQFITTPVYCILDAKDYFLTNCNIINVKNDKGKYLTTFNFTKDINVSVVNSFKHFELDASNEIRLFNRTPYFSMTNISKQIVDEDLFNKWGDVYLEEFSLMQAAMLRSGIKITDFYFSEHNWRSGIWEEFLESYLDPNNFITNLIMNGPRLKLVSSIHRRVFSKLPDEIIEKQIEIWTSLGLLTYNESVDLIREMKELNPWIS
jgi:hypothetical protein